MVSGSSGSCKRAVLAHCNRLTWLYGHGAPLNLSCAGRMVLTVQVPDVGHMHMPPWQTLPAGHTVPHAPLRRGGVRVALSTRCGQSCLAGVLGGLPGLVSAQQPRRCAGRASIPCIDRTKPTSSSYLVTVPCSCTRTIVWRFCCTAYSLPVVCVGVQVHTHIGTALLIASGTRVARAVSGVGLAVGDDGALQGEQQQGT